jgi:hypothetical protein
MSRWLLLAALLLPALWLGAGIAQQERALGQAREWRIPIQGYDPRDPIRGQYIQFRYAWRLEGDPALCERPEGCRLCLAEADGTVVATATAPTPGQAKACAAAVDPRLSQIDVRPTFGANEPPSFTSRLFISEASAPELERQLRDRPMVVVAALAPGGRLINRRIEPAG